MPCKGCVFDTRGPRWKSKRASHSRGPVINVRVNSRLVRDRKVAGYSRYGSPQENHKVRVWCYHSRQRERETRHSPSYFANRPPIFLPDIYRRTSFVRSKNSSLSRRCRRNFRRSRKIQRRRFARRRYTISWRGGRGSEEGIVGYETVARQKIGQSPNTIGFCRDKKRSDEPADISIRFTGATTGACGGPRAGPDVSVAATTGRLLLLL